MSVLAFSSRRPLRLGFAALAVLVAGSVGWGGLSSIAGAVIAFGQVEVETRDQVVEHINGGTVAALAVRDGDRVEARQVLVRLDDEQLRAERAMLEAEHAELVARRNRLEAEFRDADTIAWDSALLALAAADAKVRDILDGQRRLFEARHRSRSGQSAQLAERVKQTRQQIAGLEAQSDAVRRQLVHLARELEAQHDPQTGFGWYEVELAMGPPIESTGVLDLGYWLDSLGESVGQWLHEGGTASEGMDVPGEGAMAAQRSERELVLSPGMPVEVYVRTEARSPLDYLAKPLTDYFMRSLREE